MKYHFMIVWTCNPSRTDCWDTYKARIDAAKTNDKLKSFFNRVETKWISGAKIVFLTTDDDSITENEVAYYFKLALQNEWDMNECLWVKDVGDPLPVVGQVPVCE